ncbi:hypothetical protein DBB42_07715 [Pseudomonas plecoglossicida]|uniref:Uncharacterized protein n=1 Tax=Pseudomonas plecoglossicida TaxID=70775 RepID=A0A2R7UKT7_PSEDL|nr:hypothetical protein DBB42_07715 [Pseudomonas plecoglossicida]RFQ04162.1 hypothetical protein D0O09_07145 [Pseudomonas putida]
MLSGAATQPFRDTRPLPQENRAPCRSGLVSRWAAKRPQKSKPFPIPLSETSYSARPAQSLN